ncbi:acyl-CoA dehydrogenase [Marinobacterium zhoushanense]|uniref:Acyl-CoA dehydrogenase n=1 Tax=Marinobacterium zhoushanense TaxID=1679163 RepID=A0ABQ1KEP4_9GAMM|nr:acyl-CoA dehydrogenase [Marinobacterium zhoushanense]GGB94397.1 acyl-CoA dehydrogenase [Marinobacterium zhoushanense]
MSEYTYPHNEALFLFNRVLRIPELCQQAGLDELNDELISAVLGEAARFGSERLAPSNRDGDLNPAYMTDDGVQEPSGFAELYREFCDAGWPALIAPTEFGGQGLPNVLSVAVHEIWNSANLSWALAPLLTQGAMEALVAHGSDQLKSRWLAKLVSGEWTGTMNLTEPDAGSDLAALRTRAEPEGDHYRIKGQKIFITWGDHKMASNIVHLVLARLPDAPPGVKGISMFLVPKYLLDENGEPGEKNDLRAVSLEHKMGIHGSPTCVMSYGETQGAIGYLVGEEHQGLACMFTMMNSARQAVGLQGLAVAERAYQAARQYARERVQGEIDGQRVTIIHHPDVRRMLAQMKAANEAMRALAYEAAAEVDRARLAGDEQSRAAHEARVALYTPIVKGWLTELAQEVVSLAMQTHGGMGYIEETGVAQYVRDARILPIYEGTTGIQALDLVGRKILADQGRALEALLADIDASLAAADRAGERVKQRMAQALSTVRETIALLMEGGENDPLSARAGCVGLMMQLGYLCGGWMQLRASQCAGELLLQGEGDEPFLMARQLSAELYADLLLPRSESLKYAILTNASALMAIGEEQF